MHQALQRPFRPVEITSSTVESFSLLKLADQLMSEEVIGRTGRNSLSLARSDEMTVVLLVLKDQAVLHEHKAPGPITVTTLSGHLEFSTESQEDPLYLKTGDSAVCAAHLPHRVKALEDSAFLLVIGGRTE